MIFGSWVACARTISKALFWIAGWGANHGDKFRQVSTSCRGRRHRKSAFRSLGCAMALPADSRATCDLRRWRQEREASCSGEVGLTERGRGGAEQRGGSQQSRQRMQWFREGQSYSVKLLLAVQQEVDRSEAFNSSRLCLRHFGDAAFSEPRRAQRALTSL